LPLERSAEHRLGQLEPDPFEPGRCPAFQIVLLPTQKHSGQSGTFGYIGGRLMKTDATNWILTLLLAVLAMAGAVLVLRTVLQTREWRTISGQAASQNNFITQSQVLLNDVAAYNQKNPSPELTKLLQGVQARPAAH